MSMSLGSAGMMMENLNGGIKRPPVLIIAVLMKRHLQNKWAAPANSLWLSLLRIQFHENKKA